ncbi:chromatin structure-remodeling complex subunit Rsc9p [Trichomonascus vanleenenianus]|uniref:Rsc9p n=1 Tax=Trichomonascus vanleenenianus TaxID=2268995 RepID=UPI003EC98555
MASDTVSASASPQPAESLNLPIPIVVTTPSNHPQKYQSLVYNRPPRQDNREGQNMSRMQMALHSGIESEVDWALTSLLQFSYYNSEMLHLEHYPEMTEDLLTIISGSSLFTDPMSEKNMALGALGQSNNQYDETQRVLEALLIIRNVSLNPKDANFLAQLPVCLEIVQQGLRVPQNSLYSEFKSYCVEIIESISFHITPDSADDPLFSTLVDQLTGATDRGFIIPAMRSIARFVIQDKKNVIGSISRTLVRQVLNYLLVDDEELISAALDLLYQYTAHSSNVQDLLANTEARTLCTKHLVRLLTYRMQEPKQDYIRLPRRTKKPAPVNPPQLAEEVVKELMTYEEPHRATNWLRTSYEEDAEAEVTQISLWKAYEGQFEEFTKTGRSLLPAATFIKNVPNAYSSASAMVINKPDGSRKYIIHGIKPREFAVPPSVLNAPPVEPEEPASVNMNQPSTFGATAALVLENIARNDVGNEELQHCIPDLMKAMLLNTTVQIYVEDLLNLISKDDAKPMLGQEGIME